MIGTRRQRHAHRVRDVTVLAAGVLLGTMAVVPATAGASGGAVPTGAGGDHGPGYASAGSIDPYGPLGMNVEAAQSQYTTGDPNVLVAYVEGGINWHGNNAATLADAVYVNWHELPVPCSGATVETATMVVGGVTKACSTYYSANESDYETATSGYVNVTDWASDPRVSDVQHLGFLTPEDLIAAFSGPAYKPPVESPAGFAKAISGWDFYDGQNDPATVDGAYNHANDQMSVIHTMCPRCQILPVKAGDEAIDTTESLAKAWLFAAESGARVIVSVTADLGYSSFARQVLRYVQSKGIVVVESSNDFDSNDHQGGMYWNNVLAGNGLVANTAGLPQSVWSQPGIPGPEWTRSDLTSWGPHDQFSVATNGGSTSESTPTLGGIIALLLSEGDAAYSAGHIPAPLSGPQAVQVLRVASSQLPNLGSLPTPAPPGEWNEEYGYGMPDVLTAMGEIAGGEIPPAAQIDSPTWYQLYDPTRTKSVSVSGSVSAEPGQAFDWQLQYGLGPDPSSWTTFGSGSGTGSGPVASTLSLSAIPKSFSDAPYAFTPTGELPSADQYDVTFRLVAGDTGPGATQLTGETRLAVSVFHDPTALPGFPLQIPSSGESQPALVDLQGTGRLDIVFGTSDGYIYAIDPATGRDLPGWPVHTDPVAAAGLPSTTPPIQPGYEPIIADVAVGDLSHTGRLDVVATSADGRVYAFDAHGNLLAGFPRTLSAGVAPPPIPRPDEANVRLPVLGASAPPVLAPLSPGGGLDIVQAGWDGYLYAITPSGADVPGWPVEVSLPAGTVPPGGYTIEADHKLDTPPALAWFVKGGAPDLVIRSQYTEINESQSFQPLPYAFTFAYSAAGKLLPGWPVRLGGTIEDYGSAQELITEGSDAPSAADVLGGGVDEVEVNPVWAPPVLLDGRGLPVGSYGTNSAALGSFLGVEQDPMEAVDKNVTNDVPVPFTGSGAFGELGGRLSFAQPEIGAASMAASLIFPGTGNTIGNYTSVWPAATNLSGGTQSTGFPAADEGQAFLSGPTIADVTGSGQAAVIVGGDSSTIEAQVPGGAEAPGFPKFTGGWTVYGPSTGDLFGNGRTDLVTVTREGWVLAWSTPGVAAGDSQWWRSRHDEWNSGNYEVDSRPPGVIRGAHFAPGAASLTFTAPGAHWYDGEVSAYDVEYSPSEQVVRIAPHGPAGTVQSIPVPAGTTAVTIQAVNSTGLLGGSTEVTTSGSFPGAVVPGAPATAVVLPATNAPVTAIAAAPSGAGYWVAGADGVVTAHGVPSYGSVAPSSLHGSIVSIVATPDGRGYWLASSEGYVYAEGDARSYGSMWGHHLNKPLVAMAATPDGRGYWLLGGDGGVFSFGDARFFGSAAGMHLNKPVVGIAPSAGGRGYWLVASDGGVFTFGGARFFGSLGSLHLNRPVVGVAAGTNGAGYRLVAADGGLFAFGDGIGFYGSTASSELAAPVVSMAGSPAGEPGYWLVGSDGAVYPFGEAALDR